MINDVMNLNLNHKSYDRIICSCINSELPGVVLGCELLRGQGIDLLRTSGVVDVVFKNGEKHSMDVPSVSVSSLQYWGRWGHDV